MFVYSSILGSGDTGELVSGSTERAKLLLGEPRRSSARRVMLDRLASSASSKELLSLFLRCEIVRAETWTVSSWGPRLDGRRLQSVTHINGFETG